MGGCLIPEAMISMAITTYNRSGFTVESFVNVMDSPLIDEIVIVDDCSNNAIHDNLKKLLTKITNGKVRLYRNKRNIGGFANKIKAVRLCKSEWVIALDSDNVIDNDYIDKIAGLGLEKDILYSPEVLCDVSRTKVQWSYGELTGIIFDKYNVRDYVDNVNYEIHLNTGNNFFNRQVFLDAMALAEEPHELLVGSDACYMSYLWLLNGGRIAIIPGLAYGHRVHDGSVYSQNMATGMAMNAKIYQMMRELNPPEGGFVVNKEFKAMIKTSYDFNQHIFDTDLKWKILEELYNRNYINAPDFHANVLPKKIHQIWLGGMIPDKYKVLADTWSKFNPDWEYKLWTDADIATLNIPNRALFDSLTNYGPKSDILRYHILSEYGGLYVDTDFECLRSFYSFNFLEFFTGIGYPAKVELYPGLIGCVPHHPIMEYIIEKVKEIKSIPDNPTAVLENISSYFFTRCFWDVVTGYTERVVALPPDYFYPFPNQRGHEKRNGRVYIKDCSFALHHWCVSWLKDRK